MYYHDQWRIQALSYGRAGRGWSHDLFALLAFFPSVIPSFFTQLKISGGGPPGPLPRSATDDVRAPSLRAGSLVWVWVKEPRTGEPGEKNEAARRLQSSRNIFHCSGINFLCYAPFFSPGSLSDFLKIILVLY